MAHRLDLLALVKVSHDIYSKFDKDLDRIDAYLDDPNTPIPERLTTRIKTYIHFVDCQTSFVPYAYPTPSFTWAPFEVFKAMIDLGLFVLVRRLVKDAINNIDQDLRLGSSKWLECAIRMGRVDIAKELLRLCRGTSLDIHVLTAAGSVGNKAIIDAISTQVAPWELIRVVDGAVRRGNQSAMDYTLGLDIGGDINYILTVAAEYNRMDIVLDLLDRGARDDGYAISGAAKNGHRMMVAFMAHLAIDSGDAEYILIRAMTGAARSDNLPIIEDLMGVYCKNNERVPEYFEIVLVEAIVRGHRDIINARVITDEIKSRGINLYCALEWAVRYEQLEIIGDLVEYGIDVNRVLLEAANYGKCGLVDGLIALGATNFTEAAISAIEHGHSDIVYRLVWRGVPIKLFLIASVAEAHHLSNLVAFIETDNGFPMTM